MILALTFWSQPQVFTDSWVELASTITLIAFVIGVYKHLECHKGGCHRLGRFVHGRYKLCRIHRRGPLDLCSRGFGATRRQENERHWPRVAVPDSALGRAASLQTGA